MSNRPRSWFGKLLFLLPALLAVESPAKDPPARLIVRGDDMGFSHSANIALIKAYRQGIERSIEVIVPSPWFPEAVKLLAENPSVDVGIHLALTAEWDTVKWRPVAHVPSLVNEDGYFYPKIQPDPRYPGGALVEHPWILQDVEKELRAQIELAIKRIPRISHWSGHMDCENLSPEVAALVKRLAQEYRIDIDLAERQVREVGYDSSPPDFVTRKKGFMRMLETLQAGNSYLFVEHPGLDDEELRAIHHIGAENVARDRQAVTDLWIDPDVKALIASRHVELVSYKDLK